MKRANNKSSRLAIVSAITSAALTGWDKKSDAISKADQADKKACIAAPELALSPELMAAIGEGMKDGEAKVEKHLAAGMKDINGFGKV